MRKKLKEIFVSIGEKPMHIQKQELDQLFEKWRSTLDQANDV